MTNPKQYVWFTPYGDAEPCEAIQYDGTNEDAVVALALTGVEAVNGPDRFGTLWAATPLGDELRPGQWLIRTESGAVHVSDREPRWVRRVSRQLRGLYQYDRVILDNDIALPWEEVK